MTPDFEEYTCQYTKLSSIDQKMCTEELFLIFSWLHDFWLQYRKLSIQLNYLLTTICIFVLTPQNIKWPVRSWDISIHHLVG